MFVIDTNVISSTDPRKASTARPLLVDPEAELFLTAITIAEIEAGVQKLRRTGATKVAAQFGHWLDEIERRFSGRILPFDIDAARLAGRLKDRALGAGHNPDFADIQIAAIASLRGYTVLTRNVRHFAPLGVAHRDPFEQASN